MRENKHQTGSLLKSGNLQYMSALPTRGKTWLQWGERVLCNHEQTVNAQLRFGGRETRTREKDRYIYIDTIVCAYPLHSLLLETSTRIAGHVVSERRYSLTQSIVLAKTHSAELVTQNATSLSNTRLAYQTTTVHAIATHNAAEACLSLPPAPISL